MRFHVPAYSQYLDVKNRSWKRRSCGIVALKMALDFHAPKRAQKLTLSQLIKKGSRAGAYIRNVGWSHRGLARIAVRCGFQSRTYDWFRGLPGPAFKKLLRFLKRGPVIASMYRGLKPNASGHLVVVTGFKNGTVFYNDPDSRTRRGILRRAPLAKFLKGWKRRIIVVRPRLRRKK
jgi:predicted double-glycine peptidase